MPSIPKLLPLEDGQGWSCKACGKTHRARPSAVDCCFLIDADKPRRCVDRATLLDLRALENDVWVHRQRAAACILRAGDQARRDLAALVMEHVTPEFGAAAASADAFARWIASAEHHPLEVLDMLPELLCQELLGERPARSLRWPLESLRITILTLCEQTQGVYAAALEAHVG